MNQATVERRLLTESRVYLICAGVAAAVFGIDLWTPLGVADGVLYVAVVWAAMWSTRPQLPLVLALVCSGLTILGYYVSPEGGEWWKVVINRVYALIAIWITAVLAYRWKRQQAEIEATRLALEAEKREIYTATIHSAQHVVYNLLNQLELIRMEIRDHRDFDPEVAQVLDSILGEASELMQALSAVQKIDAASIERSVYPVAAAHH